MKRKNRRKFRAREIFIPGGQPTVTYNPRIELKLEENLEEVKDFLCKLVMMTGSTKSGKTVLTNKVFPKSQTVWFDGGSFSTENEFWQDVLYQLDGYTNETISEITEETSGTNAKGEVGVQLGLFNVKGGGGISDTNKKGRSNVRARTGNPKTIAIQMLRDCQKPLIVDDFHYLPREDQGNLVRSIKSLIFEGLPVIFIAIPHRRLDAVKVEKEMTGRIESIVVPPWEKSELLQIPLKGFPLLNIIVNDTILEDLAHQAIGSPHLMQEFCREICTKFEVKETLLDRLVISDVDTGQLYRNVSQGTGKIIFDKLNKGPRQRADRLPRHLVGGKVTDIYGLVLQALANLKPGLDTIDYETLRAAIKDISDGAPPQANEVTRVLDKMSEIAASDESSTPVIDWEKEERILHITDPFFAFYLRWGIE